MAVPPWPLRADRELEREQLKAEMTVERLRRQLNDCTDRRKVGRLERDLDMALTDAAMAERLSEAAAADEAEMWEQLWQTPQAVMWEQNGWSREVALYVRFTLAAEAGDLKAAGEARQRSDRLGLNPLALLRLRWEIERTDEAEKRGERRRSTPASAAPAPTGSAAPRKDPREAFRVVDGGKSA